VDAAWNASPAAQPLDWVRTLGLADRAAGEFAEPTCVVVDQDDEPAVALRVAWTLRLFGGDEDLPHAAIYAVRRDGRLLPLAAASRSRVASGDPGDHVRARTRAEAETRALGLRQALVASARRGRRSGQSPAPFLDRAVAAVKAAFDPAQPGFNAAPGPLRPASLALLLVAARRGDAAAAALASQTLMAMARGGVRDQLDGGFFRSARDREWRLPDFGRPARLNAALLGVYATAAMELGESSFADVARGIADYLLGTLRDPSTSAFFASQAIDERYYTWSSQELTAALPFHLVQAACMHFNVQPAARVVNDPRRNVLYAAADAGAIARFVAQAEADLVTQLADIRSALQHARGQREPPRLDRAHYVDANAEIVSALLAAARVLDAPSWQSPALAALAWIDETCCAGEPLRVPHRAPADAASRDLYLGDYAALGQAFLEAHVATGEPRYLTRAEALATALLAEFRNPRSGALVDAGRGSLVNRAFWAEQPLEDIAGRSPAATTIELLLGLFRQTGRAHYREGAHQALRSGLSAAGEDPLAAAGYHVALAAGLSTR
jgi:hypothetical protein